jgi:hypothetical protein
MNNNKIIVHACSSVLIRPNGIVRYINSVIDLQKSLGHRIIFVTDAKPTQIIHTDEVYYVDMNSKYVPKWKDDHVWLDVDGQIVSQISKAYNLLPVNPDMVLVHDIHSFLGIEHLLDDGIFVQHESDVLNLKGRYSYINDDYLQQQVNIVNNTDWRIGLTVLSEDLFPKRPVYTPVPFTPITIDTKIKHNGLLYIGDDTDRKGAKEFMDMAYKLNTVPTVISHCTTSSVFAHAMVNTFRLDQRQEMYQLMSHHRVAFIPSKNEGLCLAALECLQFMPVIVDSQYPWTRYLKSTGAILATGNELEDVIRHHMSKDTYDRYLFEIWCQNSIQYWINLST